MARGRATNGNGTIRRRKDGRWEARYTAGYNSGTGKPIRRSIYGDTEGQVAKQLREITAAIDAGTYIEPERMALKKWLDIWETEYLHSVKDSTARVYKSNNRLHIVPALGAVKLSELHTHNCQTFINSLYRGDKGKPALSEKMVMNIHGTLHKALSVAVKVGYLRANPADNVELPRCPRKEIHPLAGEQIDAFLKAIQGSPSEDLFFVALYTGMRLSEILGLQWKCVDFNAGKIKIDKQLLWKRATGDTRELGEPKNDKPRTIEPPRAVMDRLRAVRRRQAEWRLKAGTAWNNARGLVFTKENGEDLSHTTVERRYKRVVTAIGLPDRRFHDLRHTYATESIRLGTSIKVISESLGHYSVAFTMDVYGHVTDQMQRDAADRLQASISERVSKL